MTDDEQIRISLTPDLVADLREAVASGEFESQDEVVHQALREWALRRENRQKMIDEIGSAWDQGMASGPSVDGEEAFARLRETLDRLAAGSPA